MSPRFASTITGTSASRQRSHTRASTSRPGAPKRSKNAICGLTEATWSSAASSSAFANCSASAALSALAGSIPRQRGERSSISSSTRAANDIARSIAYTAQSTGCPAENLVMAALMRLRESLPSGRTLPPEVWQRRHHAMTVIVWLHAVGLAIYGLARGYPAWHVGVDVVPVITFAVAASVPYRSARFRACMVSLGLLTSSAVLVHQSGGSTEAHFHFFVMVTLLACYEEWLPYLLAILFVLFHHGVVGVLAPTSVYDHSTAVNDPWKWAGIHALFIAALCVVNVISWRMNEDARARFRGTFEDAP